LRIEWQKIESGKLEGDLGNIIFFGSKTLTVGCEELSVCIDLPGVSPKLKADFDEPTNLILQAFPERIQ
jgi:hypothetical protein